MAAHRPRRNQEQMLLSFLLEMQMYLTFIIHFGAMLGQITLQFQPMSLVNPAFVVLLFLVSIQRFAYSLLRSHQRLLWWLSHKVRL